MGRTPGIALLCASILLSACGGGSGGPAGNRNPELVVFKNENLTLKILVTDADNDDVAVSMWPLDPYPEPQEGLDQMMVGGNGLLTYHFVPDQNGEINVRARVGCYDGKAAGNLIDVLVSNLTPDLVPDTLYGSVTERIKDPPPELPALAGANGIYVETGRLSGKFQYCDSIWLSLPGSYDFVEGSFQAWGGKYFGTHHAKGAWLSVDTSGHFLLEDQFDAMLSTPIPLDDGRVAVNISLAPITGHDADGAEGWLFGFGAKFDNGLVDVRFIEPPDPRLSFYSSGDGNRGYWSDLSNPSPFASVVNGD